jgi:hypothetical protein
MREIDEFRWSLSANSVQWRTRPHSLARLLPQRKSQENKDLQRVCQSVVEQLRAGSESGPAERAAANMAASRASVTYGRPLPLQRAFSGGQGLLTGSFSHLGLEDGPLTRRDSSRRILRLLYLSGGAE